MVFAKLRPEGSRPRAGGANREPTLPGSESNNRAVTTNTATSTKIPNLIISSISADRGSPAVGAMLAGGVPVAAQTAAPPLRLSLTRRAAFARSFAALLCAGVPVTEALLTLAAHEPGARLRAALGAARDSLLAGHTYRDALVQSGLAGVAGSTGMALLHAAEVSGHLADAWEHIAETCERDLELRREALRALFYPALLLVLGCFLLPLRVLLLEGVRAYLWAALLPLLWGGGLLATGWLLWRRLGPRLPGLVMVLERVPLLATPTRRLASARAAYTLASLLDAGLPIATSLHHAAQAASRETLRRTLRAAAAAVEGGATLAEAFAGAGAEPALRIIVATGEKSGTLPASLLAYARSEKTAGEHALRLCVRALTVGFMVGAFAYLGWRSFAQVMEVRQAFDHLFDGESGPQRLLPEGLVPRLEESLRELGKTLAD